MKHDIFSITYNILNIKQERRKHNFDMIDPGINLGQVTINSTKISAVYWLKLHFTIISKTNEYRGFF